MDRRHGDNASFFPLAICTAAVLRLAAEWRNKRQGLAATAVAMNRVVRRRYLQTGALDEAAVENGDGLGM